MAPPLRHGDGHLWMIALGFSLLCNLVIVGALGMAALESAEFTRKTKPVPAPPAEMQTVATIFAEAAPKSPVTAIPAAPETKRFARTSADQAAPPAENPAFIGERSTRATSDRSPVPEAPPLPSQAGIQPRDATDIETTESDYQDGSLTSEPSPPAQPTVAPAPPAPESPTESAEPSTSARAAKSANPGPDELRSTPPPREKLAEGPNPVDIQVPREVPPDGEIKPTPEKRSAAETPPPRRTADAPKPVAASNPSRDPAFKGFQRKTAVMGSISRTGRSALDVEDSPLGRYQAAISRAVEQEWQRNCVRHRDFITPGFLTVRFFVEPSGKVRSVQFVGDMETGEVQKGFTLNSIRDAGIPPMPRKLRAEYDKEPLELIFRFYF
jgi:hypothetical protein